MLFLVSCGSDSGNKKDESPSVDSISQDSLTKNNAPDLAEQFRDFRDALYQHKIAQAKVFFDFPVLNPNNEVWIYIKRNEGIENAYTDTKPKLFSDTDFEKHFNALFPERFIRCLLKVKSDELFQTGKFDTEEILEDDFLDRIYATFDQKTGELLLNHYSEDIPGPEDEDDWAIEFNANYYFHVDKQGALKFVKIRLAG